MYAPRVLFPESSNREDLTRSVSIFDDDTGQPINLSGITFLQNPNGFTGSNWQVTDGSIVTPSVSTLIVPGYPIGNQLLALSQTVGVGLGIQAGDVVTIRDVGGNATMVGYATGYSPATGLLTSQIGWQFSFEIRAQDPHGRGLNSDYSQWDWGGGSPNGPGSTPIIQATLGNGLSIIDIGFVQINIPVTQMQKLRSRTYGVGMVMTDSVNTRQVFIGKLPMLYGGTVMLSQIAQTTQGGVPLTTEGGVILTTEGP